MKGIDVLVVRFLPFILFVIFGVNLHCAYNGIDITITYNLHSNSFIYALSLLLISLSNKKYHCIYNRAMYAFLIFVPIVNFLDEVFYFFKEFDIYLVFMCWLFTATALITAYLAIKHFVDIRIKKLTNGD